MQAHSPSAPDLVTLEVAALAVADPLITCERYTNFLPAKSSTKTLLLEGTDASRDSDSWTISPVAASLILADSFLESFSSFLENATVSLPPSTVTSWMAEYLEKRVT